MLPEFLAGMNSEFLRHLFSSIVILALFTFLRIIAVSAVTNFNNTSLEAKRKWIVFIKNITTIFFLIGLGIVWARELQSFALSIAAIAAGLAIAFKEYILCIIGGFYKTSTQLFKIGDRIEINGLRGDVVDQDLFSTRLYEIGPGLRTHQFTGKSLAIPNSHFLIYPLINETARSDYGLHTFKFLCRRNPEMLKIRSSLLEAAKEVSSKYAEEAEHQLRKAADKEGFEVPTIQPRVSFSFKNEKSVTFIVRVPAPIKRKGKIEREIMDSFLSRLDEQGKLFVIC